VWVEYWEKMHEFERAVQKAAPSDEEGQSVDSEPRTEGPPSQLDTSSPEEASMRAFADLERKLAARA
jgi:hypothetical protein